MSHNDRQAFSSVRRGGFHLGASQCPRVRACLVGLGRCNIWHRLGLHVVGQTLLGELLFI